MFPWENCWNERVLDFVWQSMWRLNTVEPRQLVKIPKECKRNVHLSWREAGKGRKFAGKTAARVLDVVKLLVVTFDLVDDGAVQLGVGCSQVLQVPGGMLSAWG